MSHISNSSPTSDHGYRKHPEKNLKVNILRFSWRESLWQEILSILGAMLCLAAIIAILAFMNNKPLASWWGGNAPISLNATISILATALKSLLSLAIANFISQSKWHHFRQPRRLWDLDLFDSASRGPQGSFIFLLNRQTLATFASVGALLTLLLLPVDPFTQQVILPVERLTAIPGVESTFGYSTSYDFGAARNQFDMIDEYKGDTLMQGAILSGLYETETTNFFKCDSSSCFWPGPYTMLGFQSSCQNITSTVKRQCNLPDGSGAGTQTCTITTPSNVNIATSYLATEWRTVVAMGSKTYRTSDLNSSYYNPNTADPMKSTKLITFAVYRLGQWFPLDGKEIPWAVEECSIEVVGLRQSDISVRNNQYRVGKTEHLPLTIQTPPSITDDWDTSPWNIRDSRVRTNLTNPDISVVFKINTVDWNIMGEFFRNRVFNGTLNGGNLQGQPPTAVGPTMFYGANMTNAAEKIALSMTNRLRSMRNHTTAVGTVLRDQTYVEVRWEYLSLHIIILAGALLYLIVVGIQAKLQNNTLWKESSLALLAHDIYGWRGTDAICQGPKALEKETKALKVQLVKTVGFEVRQ